MTQAPNNQPETLDIASQFIRLSEHDFANFGVNQIAYIRQVLVTKEDDIKKRVKAFSIHAADGQNLGMAPTLEHAQVAIMREGMDAAPVH